jgi:hypothetical protein
VGQQGTLTRIWAQRGATIMFELLCVMAGGKPAALPG